MRVLHVAPTAFGAAGLFGGGERYPLELARALASEAGIECHLVTFSAAPVTIQDPSGLRGRALRSFPPLRGPPARPGARGVGGGGGDADGVHTPNPRSRRSRLAALAVRRDTLLVTT